MSSLLLALTDELRPWLSELIKDTVKAALAESAGQPRYPEFVPVGQRALINESTFYHTGGLLRDEGAHLFSRTS